MPGMNETGPLGQGPATGRGFGRCRNVQGRRIAAVPQEPALDAGASPETQPVQDTVQQAPVYGAGRGGIPCGCGNGRAFGGGRWSRR